MHNVREEFVFLNQLRKSGRTNMFGATPFIEDEFGMDRRDARGVLMEWMKWTEENDDNVMIGVDDDDDDDDVLDDDGDDDDDDMLGWDDEEDECE